MSRIMTIIGVTLSVFGVSYNRKLTNIEKLYILNIQLKGYIKVAYILKRFYALLV